MEIVSIQNMNTEEAVRLARKEYEMECQACGQLIQDDFTEELKHMIHEMKSCRYGKAALEEGKLIGYLGFWGPWDGFFGSCKGAFSPLGGNAFDGKNRNKLASILFEQTAIEMEQEEVFSYAVCHYAHDEEVARSFVLNGFGIRCSDAILRLSEYKPSQPLTGLCFRELAMNEKWRIKELFNQLTLHLAASPCFFPADLSFDEQWFHNDKKRVFVAEWNGKIAGYLALQEEGENYITSKDTMYNICGAYVAEDYRPLGIAKLLLDYLVQVCIKEGKTYLGVDCETLNPTALRFWGKYFNNYTYSFHRRLDERVHNYQAYFDSFYKR